MSRDVSAPRAQTLAEAFVASRNSLGFLRFFLAALVVFSHSYALGYLKPDPFEKASRQETLGGVAVTSFFVLSGFLITRSYERSPGVIRYLWHRFLRIYPGFFVCLLVGAFAFAPLIAWIEGADPLAVVQGWASPALAYVRANWTVDIHMFGVSGTLTSTPYKAALNGSLWTLGWEIRCYALVAIIGAVGVLRGQRWMVLGTFVALWFITALDIAVPGSAGRILPILGDRQALRLFSFFFAGASAWLFREAIVIDVRLFLLAVVGWVLAAKGGYYEVASLVALPYMMLWLACRLPITGFDRRGDFSYGLYVYAFPVQQLLATLGVQRLGFVPYFLLSLGVTTVLAVASYYLVEAPFLRLKDVPLPFAPVHRRARAGEVAVPDRAPAP